MRNCIHCCVLLTRYQKANLSYLGLAASLALMASLILPAKKSKSIIPNVSPLEFPPNAGALGKEF